MTRAPGYWQASLLVFRRSACVAVRFAPYLPLGCATIKPCPKRYRSRTRILRAVSGRGAGGRSSSVRVDTATTIGELRLVDGDDCVYSYCSGGELTCQITMGRAGDLVLGERSAQKETGYGDEHRMPSRAAETHPIPRTSKLWRVTRSSCGSTLIHDITLTSSFLRNLGWKMRISVIFFTS
jgi:hypothetical protein